MRVMELLIKHEGLMLKPYRCPAGKLTIGVGRNLEASGITRDEAIYMLQNDIGKFDHDLRLAFRWYPGLSEARQAVLISMAFNLGMGGLSEFKQMLRSLENGDYERAADHMLNSKWAGQVKKRAVELAQMMRQNTFMVA